MNAIKINLTAVVVILCCAMGLAQPVHYQGCGHARGHAKLPSLSPEEILMLGATDPRSDTIDILDYTINLDILDVNNSFITGNCEVQFSSKMDNVTQIILDLQNLTVDSVILNNIATSYSYDNLKLTIPIPTMNTGDTETLIIHYHGSPDVDPSGFGGLRFANGYAYNLGIGLSSNPPNFGRSWFPCFDNFQERSTYEYNIKTKGNNRAFCVGTFVGQTTVAGDTIIRTYQMSQPIPTYLSSIAVSSYVTNDAMHNGLNGMIPIQLIAKSNDINDMVNTFTDLGKAIDALEYWYGPYPWERVGYVITTVGAMEHPTNIAYPDFIGIGGNSFGHRRLMAHELAHCWFGNIATVGSPMDMWFKEGNAEYGAHLMTEHAFGYDEFIDQVKDNHLQDVLRNAHINDEGFHPLSGIPFEWTYGVTTYNKGAAMIHNLRGYLGDSLFRIGQQAVLADYEYASVSGEQYRDALTAATGVDMTDFFDAWIFQPGFSAFELEGSSYNQSGGNYNVTIEVEQKLRGANNLHTNVPLEITIIDAQLNKHKDLVIVNALPTASINITSPIQPAYITINESNHLNMAHMSHQTIVDATSSFNMPHVEFDLDVQELPEPTWIHVDHYWTAPDPIINNPDNAEISPTHYWKVQGDFSNGFVTKALLEYDDLLDADLTAVTEENLSLLYRQGPNFDWQEYDNYKLIPVLPTDGIGFIRIDHVIPGEYAIANGTVPLYTSTQKVEVLDHVVTLFPNPTTDVVTMEMELAYPIDELQLEVIDLSGKIILENKVPVSNLFVQHTIDLKNFPNGRYWAIVKDENGVPQHATAIDKMAK